MPNPEKTVRVFISSTFKDMHAERDHLVTVVFPELRERVEQLGLEFFDVDLRWGVPKKDADGEIANSWEYCRKWIDAVEPFFVCLLGQRYGWVPPPEKLKRVEDQIRQAQEPRSVTDMEVRYGVLDSHFKRRSYFYLRDTLVPVLLPDATEEQLKTYRQFVDPPPLAGKLEQLKTEVRGCGRPVRGYECRWTGKGFADLDKLEKQFGPMVLEDLWSGVLRDERYVSKAVWRQVLGTDPDADPRYTDESQPIPQQFWEKIVALAKPKPKEPLDAEREQMEAFAQARLRWFQGRTREVQQLTDFLQSTAADAPRLAVVAAVPGQGKSALLAKLAEVVRSPAFRRSGPAEAGTPNSAPGEEPLTRPADTLSPSDGERDGVRGLFLITHFVGATERSANAHALVERLLGELDRSGIEWPADEQKEGEEPKRDFNSLCLRLAQRLGDYAGERRVVILLDALNQLTDGHDLRWLPARLGPSVRVIVSCVDDTPGRDALPRVQADQQVSPTKVSDKENLTPEHRVLHALASRQPAPLRVSLGPLTEEDVRTIVVAYLKEYCHELDREHLDTLCAMPQARNPLYLLVMLNELRTLGGNDLNRIVPALIAAMPQNHPDTKALFRWVLQRLEEAEGFGKVAVQWWCLYLAHGRVGMASHELADLLVRKLGANAMATALRIERGLRRYLQRRGAQLDFFHSQLRQAVMEQYGREEDEGVSRKDAEAQSQTTQIHREMADYFTACAKGTDPQKEWETDSVRGFAECVFHLTKAKHHEQAGGLLSNFPFLLHKLRVGLLEGAFEDYEMVRREAPAEVVRRLEIWAEFFREKVHILRRGNDEWPAHKILLQLAVEHADGGFLKIGAERWLAKGRCEWFWLRRIQRSSDAQKNPCVVVFEGHTSSIRGALALAEGHLLSWSDDHTMRLWDTKSGLCLATLTGHQLAVTGVLSLKEERLLSWSDDRTLRQWSQSGACLAILKGHTSSVSGALELADGRLLSWSGDHTLRLWDSQSGLCLATLEGHSNEVTGALVLTGNQLLSWSNDRDLRLWDSNSGACLATLGGHEGKVRGALALSGGRLLSWSEDGTLMVWDDNRYTRLMTLEGHRNRVVGALELADKRLLSWSDDHTLRLWNSQSGRCMAILAGHKCGVFGALTLANERLLSWAFLGYGHYTSPDYTLRVWDSRNGACLTVLEGHTSDIFGALELDGGQLLSWSRDTTLRLWDSRSGKCLTTLQGHGSGVAGALALASRRLLSWSGDGTLRLWDRTQEFAVANQSHEPRSVVALIFNSVRKRFMERYNRSEARFASVRGHNGEVSGVVELPNERLVSWSGSDSALCIWDRESGSCVGVLKGHTSWISGALALSEGRVLSWSDDHTLRLWDSQNGVCLATLTGHTSGVWDASVLADGRLLSHAISWSFLHLYDHTLRLWDSRSGACLGVFIGHTDDVGGTLELKDDRLLSWSSDKTLRVWNCTNGRCLLTLTGHTDNVYGAAKLADGRVHSWAADSTVRVWDIQQGICLSTIPARATDRPLILANGTLVTWPDWYTWGGMNKALRLWDTHSGKCLVTFTGHTAGIDGALELARGQLLSWSRDRTLRLWDCSNGACLEVVSEGELASEHPEWRHARALSKSPHNVVPKFLGASSFRTTQLQHKALPGIIAAWDADSKAASRYLLQDGTLVVTLDSGQVCILKLYHSQRRVSLAEAEELLRSEGRIKKEEG